MKVLITGASRGIGLFLMQKMKDDGFEVYGIYKTTEPPKELISKFTQVDVSEQNQVTSWVNNCIQPGDKVILINCAGVNYNAFAHKADIEKWKYVIDINLVSTFRVIHSILPLMRESGFGRIINFSSIVAQKGVPGTSAYAASKAALWGLTKSIALESAQKGITINTLNLGYFDIGMITEVPEEFLSVIKKSIPMQRLGDPDNIYNVVKFLVNSEYITGTTIDINGGYY